MRGDLGVDTLVSASVAASGKNTQAKCRLLCWCYKAQSGVKESGLRMIRGCGCCTQQPDSPCLVEDSTKQHRGFPEFYHGPS